MTPEVKQRVQESWSKVIPIADRAGMLFYQNLFEAEPGLKPLFKGDMQEQATKLTTMITTAVARLDNLDVLVPVLKALGKRHEGYGVKAAHYQVVGAALLKTLEQGLGDAFTDDTRHAWATVYGVMTDVMTGNA